MIKCSSYEELKEKYPLDGIHNYCYIVDKTKENCLTEADLKILKTTHPNGYFDKEDHKYEYYYISSYIVYDHYCFDGEYWYLGLDSWDGIYFVDNLPDFGIVFKGIRGTFQTIEEAEKYKRYLESPENFLKF